MIVHALRGAGMDPGWLVGGTVGDGLANAHWSDGEWLVVEADESDRSMLSLERRDRRADERRARPPRRISPRWRSCARRSRAFAALATQAIVVWDRPELLELMPDGPAELARFDVAAPQLDAGGSQLRLARAEVRLAVPGAHNALNAAAALEAARLAGARRRRRDRRPGGLSRRRAALSGARAQPPRRAGVRRLRPPPDRGRRDARRRAHARSHERLVAVFQPHLYSRTRAARRGFGRALARADVVVVLDVYAARERAEDHPGVSGLLIAEAAADAARGRPVYWLPRFDDAAAVLDGLLGAGDVCMVMGAGDVDRARPAAGGGVSDAGAPPPPGVERDVPIARLSTVGRAARRVLRARRQRAAAVELLAWAERGRRRGQRRRLGLEPADRRRGRARAGAQARPRAREDRASRARASSAAAARVCRRSPRAPRAPGCRASSSA